jgi:serine/threonine-protein kinase
VTDLRARLQAALGDAYRIERELGGGGMSRVFVAEEVALGRKVVVKVLPPEMGAGVNSERFRREIQLAASLQHPHLVPVHTAGHTGDLFYYTMPLVEGESLRETVAREGGLPVATVLRLLTDVVGALAYAHRQGIVHRDIKPGNVLVAHQHAMVTDFGVAKAVSEALPHGTLTSAGMAVGTPGYMAPEQAAGDPQVDHRCDLYAVGTLAYEMLTGRPAFWGHEPQIVLARQLTEDPPPLDQHRPDTPPALASAVMRCLARDPAQRWQTADELLAALEAAITPGGTPTGVALPRRAHAPRRVWLAGGLAAALLLIGGLTRLVLSRTRAAASPAAIAVFPFTVRGGADIAYLGEGIVNLLSTSLDGAGELRSVDPRGLLALVHSERLTMADPASALRLANRLHAGLFVLGDIVQVGDRRGLAVALYTPGGGVEPPGEAVVDGARRRRCSRSWTASRRSCWHRWAVALTRASPRSPPSPRPRCPRSRPISKAKPSSAPAASSPRSRRSSGP